MLQARAWLFAVSFALPKGRIDIAKSTAGSVFPLGAKCQIVKFNQGFMTRPAKRLLAVVRGPGHPSRITARNGLPL